MLRRNTLKYVRPFGAWAPPKNLEELKARTPRPADWNLRPVWAVKKYCYYEPELLAQFKDPQHCRDCIDKIRSIRTDSSFFGDGGFTPPENEWWKLWGAEAALVAWAFLCQQIYYNFYMASNNPRMRKLVNKEWEEAINNSPWDHRSHCWLYSDMYGVCLGDLTSLGRKKFYIPC